MYISGELEEPFRFTGALNVGDVFSFQSLQSNEIMLAICTVDSSIADKEDMTTMRFVVGTIMSPIQLNVTSKLIMTASNAAADKMQSKVGGGLETLVKSLGSSEMAVERIRIVSAECRDCKWHIRPSCKCCIH